MYPEANNDAFEKIKERMHELEAILKTKPEKSYRRDMVDGMRNTLDEAKDKDDKIKNKTRDVEKWLKRIISTLDAYFLRNEVE